MSAVADIIPFRGWRFNPERVSPLDDVVAPPYDVIDEDLKEALYDRHPHNITRVILGRDLPTDSSGQNRYTRAAEFLRSWINEGVLVQDPEPSFYFYFQTFTDPWGRRHTRKGFVALVRVEPFDKGMVLPHEQTFPKHKEDRLMLMRACKAHFNPVFSFFPDTDGLVRGLLEDPGRQPIMMAVDDDGVENVIWRINDPARLSSIAFALKDRPVFIADGHHRYETCLNYLNELRSSGIALTEDHPARWTLMFLTPMEDDGLVILPTHKMVVGLNGFSTAEFMTKLNRWFRISTINFHPDGEMQGRVSFLSSLREKGAQVPAIGVALHGQDAYHIITPRDPAQLGEMLSHMPPCLRGLDVTLLHEVIFKDILGIDISDPSESHLSYVHDEERCLRRVRDGRVQVAFVMNPTKIEDLKTVALAGEKMPQKATYFYPKLLSGLVMNIMSF